LVLVRLLLQYGEFRQGYDKDRADTRLVFYGLRYILETFVQRRWTPEVCRACWLPA
jgi:hypothetical protein